MPTDTQDVAMTEDEKKRLCTLMRALDGYKLMPRGADLIETQEKRIAELDETLAAVLVWAKAARKSQSLVGPSEYHERPDLMRVWVKTRYRDARDVQNIIRKGLGSKP